MKSSFLKCAVMLIWVVAAGAESLRGDYDPLRIGDTPLIVEDTVVKDEKRSREIPLRVYLPSQDTPAEVVLFSHGLGGTRGGCSYLGNHWAARGYVAVFLQHPGSDDSVWKNVPPQMRMAAIRKAAGVEKFLLRVQDVSAVLDQLEAWNESEPHFLARRLDLAHVGMSGHSFGAVTTQAVSGQKLSIGRGFTDERIKAAVLLSPSGPRRGGDPREAFGGVKIPWLLLTGTKDEAPIGGANVKSRLEVFPALPPEAKYELLLHEAEHSAFSDHLLPGDRMHRNPNHHRAILSVSTAFWDAYLRGDQKAEEWLDGKGVLRVLDKQDRWQKK